MNQFLPLCKQSIHAKSMVKFSFLVCVFKEAMQWLCSTHGSPWFHCINYDLFLFFPKHVCIELL